MPTYRYQANVLLQPDAEAVLSIEFPDHGSAAVHEVDKPGPADARAFHQAVESLGVGTELIDDRVIITSTAFNLDPDNAHVRVRYLINGDEVVFHSNAKSADHEPFIKIIVTFQEA